jgi:ribosomal protein S18 acetylase RimI-like enzyme
LASDLYTRAWALAKQRTGTRLWLAVNAKNQRALAFYRRHGYTHAGLSAFVLDGVAHENHVMVGAVI